MSSALWIILLASCVLSVATLPAIAQQRSSTANKIALTIQLQNQQSTRIGSPEVISASQSNAASLDIHRAYQPGDRLLFNGPQEMAVRVDQSMPECLLFVPDTSALVYQIPYGRAEQQTGSAYAPDSFMGDVHRVTARAMTEKERHLYRNLALNPCDQPLSDLAVFPHATSNSVARNLFVFAARNAIDGSIQNGHHGVWPYQSWGPELTTDVWWSVNFGRSVKLDKIRMMLRADFPHDGTWKSADVQFSDGSSLNIQLRPTVQFQEIRFPARWTTSVRLVHLVPENPGTWCSLIELEAWGRE